MALSRVREGIFQSILKDESDKEYNLIIENQGSMFKDEFFTLPAMAEKAQTITKEYTLAALEVGFKAILRNIYFDFDKATFRMESYQELKQVEKIMKDNPNIRVQIAGHTDAAGSEAYNLDLSQRRANAVVEWLVKKGIDRSRLISKGFGESKPLATNDDEVEGRELNRRTEFEVIEDIRAGK
jgi:outer membrane protein OmpA-like peptidoglycan-associated protein